MAEELWRASAVEPGPLFGVPVTIKVNVDQEGGATTNGLLAFANGVATLPGGRDSRCDDGDRTTGRSSGRSTLETCMTKVKGCLPLRALARTCARHSRARGLLCLARKRGRDDQYNAA